MLLHTDDLEGHLWTVGSTGGGKTSQMVMPLLIQLLRGPLDEGAREAPTPPVLILDLKGDRSLFHTALEEANRSGAPFRFFSLQGQGGAFNPLRQLREREGERASLVSFLMDALGQFHGQGYGKSFFAGESQQVLDRALDTPGALENFKSLYLAVKSVAPKHRDLEIVSTLHRLAGFQQLQAEQGDEQIDMREVLSNGEVCYFFLDPADGTTAAIDVARLALYAALDAAIQRKRRGEPTRPTYVVIDEFQKIAGGDEIGALLAQGREYGLRFILANQSLQDLKKSGTNLLPVIQTNTAVKALFTVDDGASVNELATLSGERIEHLHTSTSDGVGWREAYRPNLSAEMIRQASSDRGWFILQGRGLRGMGAAWNGGMPIVRALYPITKEQYVERRDRPLPQVGLPPTLAPSSPAWFAKKKERSQHSFAPPVWQSRIEALTELLLAEEAKR